MAVNNWDRESEILFSRIQRQRKQSKFEQYRGGKMGMASDPSWSKKEEGFSEELKQIVRETKGVWDELADNRYIAKLSNGYCYADTKLAYCYSRSEFEGCLMEMTGRPKVEDWPDWAKCVTQDEDGSWTAWIYADQAVVSADGWYEKQKYDSEIECHIGEGSPLNWRRSLMTKDEALERERIIASGNTASSSEVELQPIGEANAPAVGGDKSDLSFGEKVEDLLKRTDKKLKDKGREYMDTAISGRESMKKRIAHDYGRDWFRNGELPPVGENVKIRYYENDSRYNDFNGQEVEVIGFALSGEDDVVVFQNDIRGLGCLICRRKAKGPVVNMLPSGFDISAIHQEALDINDFIDIAALLSAEAEEIHGDTVSAAAWLYSKGLRFHPELAE